MEFAQCGGILACAAGGGGTGLVFAGEEPHFEWLAGWLGEDDGEEVTVYSVLRWERARWGVVFG